MLLATVLASALFLCPLAGQKCPSTVGVFYVKHLIQKLQVTHCLCLPVPSDNCSTPCFQEGLSQMTNFSRGTDTNIYQVIKIVKSQQKKNCQAFSCGQPCNQTTDGNVLTFLTRLRETFQKENERSRNKNV
ncbi:interleukin-9 [Echinops telfairi]|uniref:Interleukin-9 n=1 Tax=Echinops telfairi TaxID=9371 RepID=A0ABM0ICP1_ECHTE|nr:interleukin-9 [Echinops telfairi]